MLEKGFTVPELAEPVLPIHRHGFPCRRDGSLWAASCPRDTGFSHLSRLQMAPQSVASSGPDGLTQPQTVDSWLLLMKRILLVHQPREQVSGALDPAQWLPSVPLDNALRQRLCERYCQPDNQLSDADTARLRVQLRTA